jgi:hypothetical protein
MHKLHAYALLLCSLLVPGMIQADEPGLRRSFEPGGPETMMLTGVGQHSVLLKPEITANSMSFSFRPLFDICLYLDEQGARNAFAAFKGSTVSSLLETGKIQRAVIEGDFPRMMVLRFSDKRSAREIRDDLSEAIGRAVPRRSPAAGKFIGYFRKDFADGDEVVIRLTGDKVRTTIAGAEMPEIQSRDFVRGLLGMWINKGQYERELLADAGPLLQ